MFSYRLGLREIENCLQVFYTKCLTTPYCHLSPQTELLSRHIPFAQIQNDFFPKRSTTPTFMERENAAEWDGREKEPKERLLRDRQRTLSPGVEISLHPVDRERKCSKVFRRMKRAPSSIGSFP